MKRHISIFAFLLCAFAVVGLSAFAAGSGSDNMRLSPIGYRLGETGVVTAYDPSVVTVAPSDTSIVTSNKAATLTATLNRDYKVVRWQKFDGDPRQRPLDPIEEFGEKSETVSVDFNPNVAWMYVTVVVEYDPVRTVKARRSSFGKGTVTIDPETNVYRKGESVTLTAEPAEGYSFVRWSDGNADHVRTLTVSNDVDLTAYIEPISSRVSFSAGAGARLDVTSKRVSYGNAYGELPVPTRTGAKFSGWMDDEKRTVTAKTEVNRTVDHTLYASWSDLLHEIAWDFTGRGNGKVEGAGTYAYGSQPTLKAVPYEGSAFTGWTDGVTLNPRRITVLSNALYVAAFDVATYDVTFTYRDASGNLVTTAPATVEHGGKVDPPSVPEWPEHTFANWSTEEYKKVTRDLSVEAIYDTMTYSVAFAYRDWQGNSVTTMPQHVTAGGKANPPDRSVVDNWTGNTFKGWAPDYNVIRQDTLCEAIYDNVRCTVKFSYRNADGNLVAENVTVNYGEAVLETSVPPKSKVDQWSDHEFLGWDEGYAEATNCVTDDLTVNARYKDVITVIYSPGKGQGDRREFDLEEEGSYVILNPTNDLNYSRIGYTFDYWQSDDKKNYQPGDTVKLKAGDTLALTAHWANNKYTIAFDGNGGECNKDPYRGVKYDEQKELTFASGDFIYDDHYVFVGLGTNREEVLYAKPNETAIVYWRPVVSNLTAEANATVTLYAIWQGKPQTVVINGEPVELDYGSQLEKPDDPAPKPGYTFTGEWHTNNNVTVSFPITVTGGFDLDPNETPNRYRVAFHGNGEDGGVMEPQEFTYDKWQTLMPSGFTRTGYTFAGWATNATGAAVYMDKQSVGNLAADEGMVVDLWATWAPNTYAVRFDPGEGTGEMGDQSFVYDVPQNLAANAFTAPERKAFDCWTNALNSTTYTNYETVCNLTTGGVFALYATWKEAPGYTVAFDANGGEGEMSELRLECGKGGKLPANGFTRTGYAFDQWTNKVNGATYGDGATFTEDLAPTNGMATLSALWTPNRYWVKFDGNGATGGKMDNQEFTYDVAQTLTSNAFTKTGYSFDGWKTNETGAAAYVDGAVVSNLTAEADATNTLWATWTANHYTVRFNPNGGSGDITTQGFTYDQPQKLADNAFDPPEPLESFAGWATNETGKAVYANGAEVQNLTAEADGMVNLYAVWGDDSYTVTFDGNGATGTMEPQVFKHGETDPLTSNAFTRTGCGFAGWADSEGSVVTKYADGANFTAPATGIGETLYAVWTNDTYDCTFVERAEDNQRRKYGEKLDPLPGNPSKTGYMFGGWTTNGSDVVNLSAFTMPDHDVVFTPLWTPITYTIAFDGNGATDVAMAPTNVKYDVEIALPSNTYEWAGHEFVGWSEDKNATQKKWGDGETVLNLTTTDGATMTLYAVWKETGDPLRMALGLKPEFDGNKVSVSAEGAWTVIEPAKEAKGVIRTSTSPEGQLRIAVPGSGTLSFTFEPLDDGANALKVEKEDGSWSKQSVDGLTKYPISFDAAGAVIFSGTPTDDATWTLKDFTWTAK